MKITLAVLAIVGAISFSHPVHAHVVTPPPAYVCPAGVSCAAAPMWPAAVAVGLAAFVIYADATGIPFPLCGLAGLQCFADYPSGNTWRDE